jgi:hypothetical protein
MAILFFVVEEPIRNGQQQDCCLIVEVHAPDWINNGLVLLAAESAIEAKFGKRLMLLPAYEDEASQYLEADPGAARGSLTLGSGDPLFWHLLRIG